MEPLGIQAPACKALSDALAFASMPLRRAKIARRNSRKEDVLLTEVTETLRQQCQLWCAQGSIG